MTSISSNPDPYRSSFPAKVQAKEDFKALASDVKSVDLASGRQDFAAMLQAAPQLQVAQTTSQSTEPNALSSALQSGEVSGAQSAMSSIQPTMKSHHHHHHHSGSGPVPIASQTPVTSPADDPSAAASDRTSIV